MAAKCPAPKINPKLVLSPGDLRNQVIVETVTDTKQPNGKVTRSGSPFATVYCSIDPLSARWAMVNAQPATTGFFKIRMRYLPGLTAEHRINFGGRIMLIKEIMNIEEWDFVHELTVQEDQSNG